MYQVIKRTGETVAFDIKKIENAIVRAFVATNKNYNEDVIQMLALRASARFADKITAIRSALCCLPMRPFPITAVLRSSDMPIRFSMRYM